jgi:hypothetical protein
MKRKRTDEDDEKEKVVKEKLKSIIRIGGDNTEYAKSKRTLFSKYVSKAFRNYIKNTEIDFSAHLFKESIFCVRDCNFVIDGCPLYWYYTIAYLSINDPEFSEIKMDFTTTITNISNLPKYNFEFFEGLSLEAMSIKLSSTENFMTSDIHTINDDECGWKSKYLFNINMRCIGDPEMVSNVCFITRGVIVLKNEDYHECEKLKDIAFHFV